MPHQFRGQSYKSLRAQCERAGNKFVDGEFAPDAQSLFFDRDTQNDIAWKRPCELVSNPRLFVEGASSNDVKQGAVGNCWFVAACSALTHNKKLMDTVIPDAKSQEWSSDRSDSGIFHFQFWRFGKWVDVVIDDFLPTRHGKLCYARSKTANEFWSALLEKAFAKLYGCYEALAGGQLCDALVEVSGGIPEIIQLASVLHPDKVETPIAGVPPDTSSTAASGVPKSSTSDNESDALWTHLKEAYDDKALVVAAIQAKDTSEIEQTLDCGLVKAHAYAVTKIMALTLDNVSKGIFESYDTERMLRLHNPWGKKEWNGPWSDGSSEWAQVTDEQKRLLGITIEDDGEFWMTWADFLKWFTDVSMCHQKQTGFFSGANFHESAFFGAWKAARRPGDMLSDLAGGCHNNRATFLCNPQYRFDVTPAMQSEQVMISLTQRDFWGSPQAQAASATADQSEGRVAEDREARLLIIGLHVLKVEDNRQYRLHRETPTVAVSRYAQQRSAFVALRKPAKGRYVVLPTTFEPLHQADFMLRIAAGADTKAKELTEHRPSRNVLASCCVKKYVCVTKITIVGARNLADARGNKNVDPYCIVSCEGATEKTRPVAGECNPSWNCEYIFYRKDPLKHIEVDIWDSNYGFDSSLGRVAVDAPIGNSAESRTVDLCDRRTGRQYGGTLQIVLATYDDLLCL